LLGALGTLAACWVVPAAAQSADTKPVEAKPTEAKPAPDPLTIRANLRVRYEALDGQFRPGLADHDDAVLLQTDIALGYTRDAVTLGAELIDARAYDNGPGSAVGTNEVNALELSQAYISVALGDALGKGTGTSLTAGRMALSLGSRRLAARNNFRNTVNSFTGIKAEWRGAAKDSLTLFYVLPQIRLPSDPDRLRDNAVQWDRESFDLAFFGGAYSRPRAWGRAGLDLYLLGLDEDDGRDRPTRNRQLVTGGARLFAPPAPGKIDFDVEAAIQRGTIRTSTAANAARVPVHAWFVHAEIGRRLASGWTPRLSASFDAASGDDRGSRAYERFDSLFGARRADFGPTSLFGPLARTNLLSAGTRLELTPNDRIDLMTAWRANWLESRDDRFANTGVFDPAGASGRFAGHQVELRARYWLIPKRLRFEAGGALLTDGRFLNEAPNANGFGTTHYGYSELSLSF